MKRSMGFIFLIGTFLFSAGFNLQNAIVPEQEILSGGPPKDGIPAILKPVFIKGDEADFIEPGDRIIGITVGGEARAYPIKILNWHEVVNDTIKDKPLMVTF